MLLVVEFRAITEGKQFKEMVQDFQSELLTGGVHTNAFRPKQKRQPDGTVSSRDKQVAFYTDSRAHAMQALEWLRSREEVAWAEMAGHNEL